MLLYNIALTSALTLAIACAYYLYMQEKNRVYTVAGVLFGLYLLDNTIVFCTESISYFASLYDKMFLASPSWKTIYFIGVFACVLSIYYSVIKAERKRTYFVLLSAYAILLICIPLIPKATWMVWLYYLVNQAFLFGIAAHGVLLYRRRTDLVQTLPHSEFRKMLIFLMVMCVAILIEDTVVIFYYDVYSLDGLKINNRNWMENVLYLGLCVCLLRFTVKTILHNEALPQDVEPQQPLQPQRSSIHEFGSQHLLTEREQEILKALLEGKGVQEISQDLIIAQGTVKTHIHNIYHKVGVAKREHLTQKYQEFCNQFAVLEHKE